MENRIFINGRFVETENRLLSYSPSTEEPISDVNLAGEKEIEEALSGAQRALKEWARLKPKQRAEKLYKARDFLVENLERYARLIALEQGKPIVEAIAAELYPALSALDYIREQSEALLAKDLVSPSEPLFSSKEAYYIFQPSGVSLIISPWNYPFIIPFLDALFSLYAGNTVIFRPSTSTPLIGIAVAEVFAHAELPKGTFQLIVMKTQEVERIIKDARIRTILFTGSVPTGRKIAQIAGGSLKKVILELGGKDPMIVLEDADLERAVRGALWAGFMNAGQTCASVERIYVHKSIKDRFIKKLTEKVKKLRVGDPLQPSTDMGPLTTRHQFLVVEEHIREAREKSAEVITGGEKVGEKGFFYAPTVVTGVNHSLRIMREETFGPVVAIMEFEKDEEAVALANDTEYGLSASIWTTNRARARRLAEKLEAGTVAINDHIVPFAEPSGAWGGVKNSGIGRTHGKYGLLDLVNLKYVMEDFSRRRDQLWWYPYDEKKFKLLTAATTFIYGRNKLKALPFISLRLPFLLRKAGLSNLIAVMTKLLKI